MTGYQHPPFINENWIGESKFFNACSYLGDLLLVMSTGITGIGPYRSRRPMQNSPARFHQIGFVNQVALVRLN